MKRLFLILAIYFFVQVLFVTVWFALGVADDPESVKNFKFFSWAISIALGILFLVLYSRKKKKEANRLNQ
jgi:hypothetical protein